jgi:hypothetical protein
MTEKLVLLVKHARGQQLLGNHRLLLNLTMPEAEPIRISTQQVHHLPVCVVIEVQKEDMAAGLLSAIIRDDDIQCDIYNTRVRCELKDHSPATPPIITVHGNCKRVLDT